MTQPYNYRNCQSLFGYAEAVHRRSGGVCQLCGCGAGDHIDFNLWRQFTVEHLIGESQKGYLKDLKKAVAQRFPNVPAVYAMFGGQGRSRHVAYVGLGSKLRGRIEQHLVRRDSSLTTGVSAVSLNPDFVTLVRWWEDPEFEKQTYSKLPS